MKRRNRSPSTEKRDSDSSSSSLDPSSSSSSSQNNHNSNSAHKDSRRNSAKRLKFISTTAGSTAAGNEPEFPKLDPSNEEHARRIQQRRRMISFGKNTVGYDEYVRQVPKEKRRFRCMETPMTPDHTLDIPNKRWTGQLRAWRRALHQYDPADLQKSLAAAENTETKPMDNKDDPSTKNALSVKDRELAQAKSTGLLVAFDDETVSPTSVVVRPTSGSQGAAPAAPAEMMKELDQWDNARGDGEFFCSDDDESDDDLL